jgi:chromosome segregation ATPase
MPEERLPKEDFKENQYNAEHGEDENISDEDDYYDSEEDGFQDIPLPLNHAASLEKFQNANENAQNELFDSVQNTLKILSTDNNTVETQKFVEKLSQEYTRLKDLFSDSRKQTNELVMRSTKMSAELADSAQKMHALIETSQKDRAAVIHLKKELKKAWKSVEENAEKDTKAKEVISSLKNEVSALKMTTDINVPIDSTISSGSLSKNKLIAIQMEQEELIKKLNRGKMEIERELLDNQNEVKRLKIDLEEEANKGIQFAKEREYLQEEVNTLKEYLAAKKSEHEREVRAKEKFEQQIRHMADTIEKKDQEVRNRQEEGKALKDSLNKTEGLLQGEQARCEKIESERDTIYSQHIRLQQDFDLKDSENVTLTNQTLEQAQKLGIWHEEITKLRENYKDVLKSKQSLMKKYKLLEEAKIGSEMERDGLRSTNSHLQRELETTQREFDQASKNFEMVSRERDISQKNFVKSTTASLKQYSVLKLSEQDKRNLEQEISGYKDEAQKMRKIIYALEKERDSKSTDLDKIMQALEEKGEEIKMKDVVIFDSKKKITDVERKLKEQQALYESVRTDRNVYSKNLLESQDEIMEMKRKLKIMTHQVEQLKEEISSRESVLVKEHFEHAKLDKEKEALLLQIAKLQQQHEESYDMIQNQKCEEEKLRHTIAEADHERIRQKKEYESVVQERDILGTQLIRRNDELSLLYEKIKIQMSTLNKGEIQYRERLEDIRVLRLEIKKLRREKAMLQTESQNVDSLRNEIFKLQRDILRERTRVKVLEEELESPMNIHRWRKLAGSDPSSFELISKIQTLQKRLITKTEEVVEKELVIQQKDKLYNDVKKVLQRQPGPEVMEELQSVRSAIKSKVRESKVFSIN